MKAKTKHLNLPINYSLVDFSSDRFLKMRIKVMHSGLNLKNSFFGKEAIEKAKPTLANIPILAFVKKTDGMDNSDFAAHEFEIKIVEGELRYVYLGRPIGIIPETNNYEVIDENGQEYVVVDGYIWKAYANDALNIIQRDEVKQVSMEVSVNDYEWEESYINVKDYIYTGIAMLGEDVRPGMIGAQAEIINYSSTKITEMMQEMKKALEEGGKFMEGNTENKDVVEQTIEEVKASEATENLEEKFEEGSVEGSEIKNEEKYEEKNVEKFEENVELGKGQDDDSAESGAEENQEVIEFSITEDEVNELKNTIETLNAEIITLKQENTELMSFKEEIIKTQKEEIVAKFTDLEEADLEIIKSKLNETSLEDLETKLYALRGKKLDFAQEKPKNKLDQLIFALSNSGSKTDARQPEWVELVKANINGKGGE